VPSGMPAIADYRTVARRPLRRRRDVSLRQAAPTIDARDRRRSRPNRRTLMTMPPSSSAREIAVLGGGCFWCLEAVFDELAGVLSVESGYAGGHTADPGYEDVCSGRTGHAEVVRITFDPTVLSFADLLRIFFTIHDPTTLNRQGNDVGTQYRSSSARTPGSAPRPRPSSGKSRPRSSGAERSSPSSRMRRRSAKPRPTTRNTSP